MESDQEKSFSEAFLTVKSLANLSALSIQTTKKRISGLFAVGNNAIGLQGSSVSLARDNTKIITFGNWDDTIRICIQDTEKVIYSIQPVHQETTTSCVCIPDGSGIITGGSKSIITIWNLNNDSKENFFISLKRQLFGHTDTVLSLDVSLDFRIFVSGSKDCSAIIWDLDSLNCAFSLDDHVGSVTHVAISPQNGDIVCFASDSICQRNQLSLWSINGHLIARKNFPNFNNSLVSSILFSPKSVDLVNQWLFTGMVNGDIIIWDAFDLQQVLCLNSPENSPVNGLCFSTDLKILFSGHSNGKIISWGSSSKKKNKEKNY
ncbi:beach domain-containing protein [Anaeramoeba ignava]|uniref:Beach domain-containing protein n=1 Tax=Anaeramoeba ignava TaxID=1746090 RepID=A0A9Q0RFH7_ANAIG|nr:beach domain-containing protein [Anaeramoeba ignava]